MWKMHIGSQKTTLSGAIYMYFCQALLVLVIFACHAIYLALNIELCN